MQTSDKILILAAAEIAEALGDLTFAALMPEDNNKKVKISGCYAGIQRALARLDVPDRINEEAIRLGRELGVPILKKIEQFNLTKPDDFFSSVEAREDLPAFVENLISIVGYKKPTKTSEG